MNSEEKKEKSTKRQIREKIKKDDKKFEEAVMEITGNFKKGEALQDSMFMFSDNRGAKKFSSLEEFERYQALVSNLNKALSANRGNHEKAYVQMLGMYPEDSVEYKIIQKYLDRIRTRGNER